MTRPLPELRNAWLGATVCVLFATASGWLSFDDISSHHHLATDGVPSTAQIIDRRDESTRRNPEFWLRVRTDPPWAIVPPAFDRNSYSFESDTPPPGEWDIEVARWEYESATPGGRLKVLNLPDITDRPIPSSTLTGWRPPYVGILLTLAFLAGAAVFVLDGWRDRKAR